MTATTPDLAALSALLLRLHRGGRDWPAGTFQRRAAELLAELLPFDVLVWGAAAPAGPLRLDAPGLFVQGLQAADRAAYLQAGASDSLLPPGMAHRLCRVWAEPLAGRRLVLGLWRHAGAADFNDAEQQTLQFLLPHLMDAWRENSLLPVPRAGDAGASTAPAAAAAPAAPPSGRALCGADGLLLHVDEKSLALLRVEWPRWAGGRLPAALLAHVAAQMAAHRAAHLAAQMAAHLAAHMAAQMAADMSAHSGAADALPFSGRHIHVQLSAQGELMLLELRRRTPVDRLSARQRGIAELYADGLTAPQIALQLGLAPSTVNNHLSVVFKKLAVGSKVQLLRLLRLLPPR